MRVPNLVATRCNDRDRIARIASLKSSCISDIEVDLMVTRDGKLVVGHPSIFQARDYTLVEARAQKGALTIDELAEIVLTNKLDVFLDLKYGDMGELVAGEIRRVGLQDHSVLISWGQQNLATARRVDKELKTGWIFNGALEDPAGDVARLGCSHFVTCFYYLTSDFWVKLRKLKENSEIELCLRKVVNSSDLKVVMREDVDYIFMDSDTNLKRFVSMMARLTTELIDEL